MLAQKELSVQELESLDLSKITPLNPEIISRQATINIGTIGHVAHGKSTLVRAISNTNVSTQSCLIAPLTYFYADCSSQTRIGKKYHYQIGICKCKALQVPKLPTSSVLHFLWVVESRQCDLYMLWSPNGPLQACFICRLSRS